MLHVRLVSPAALTGRLADVLAAAPGVQNLVVQAGAASRPDGDAVQFDMHDEAANPVFRDLRVPVWELVEATIRAGAAYSPSFYILLVIAGLIGAVGILTNSQILIVGAMVVGPEYSAIIATALGISNRDRGLVRDGLLALFWGFLAAIVVTLLFGLAVRWAGKAPASFLHGTRPVSNLINTPNIYSVIVAILAALVGVVSLTEARANALIGVFISVTTIPAAADVGVSLAFSGWHEAWGSALQLLLNIVLLIAVGAGGLLTQRMIWHRRRTRSPGLSQGRVSSGSGD